MALRHFNITDVWKKISFPVPRRSFSHEEAFLTIYLTAASIRGRFLVFHTHGVTLVFSREPASCFLYFIARSGIFFFRTFCARSRVSYLSFLSLQLLAVKRASTILVIDREKSEENIDSKSSRFNAIQSGSIGGGLEQSTFITSSPLDSGLLGDWRLVNNTSENSTYAMKDIMKSEIYSFSTIKTLTRDNSTQVKTFDKDLITTTDDPLVQPTTLQERDNITDEKLEKVDGSTELSNKKEPFEGEIALRLDVSSREERANDNNDQGVPLKTTTIQGRGESTVTEPLGEPDLPILLAANASAVTSGMRTHQPLGTVLSGVVLPTDDIPSYQHDNGLKSRKESPTRLSMTGNISLPKISQKGIMMGNGLLSLGIDREWKHKNNGSALSAVPGNSTWSGAHRGLKKIPEKETHRANRNSDPHGTSKMPNDSIKNTDTKSEHCSNSSEPARKVELRPSSIIQMLEDVIAVEAARQMADEQLLLAISKTARKFNKPNSTDRSYRPFNRSWGSASAGLASLVPHETLTQLDSVFPDHSWKSGPKLPESYPIFKNKAKNDQKISKNEIARNVDSPFSVQVRDRGSPAIKNKEDPSPSMSDQICHVVEIMPKEVCKKLRRLCTKKRRNRQSACALAQILCERDAHYKGSQRIRLICENQPPSMRKMMGSYSGLESFPIGKVCSMIAGKLDTLACMDPLGMEEVGGHYEKKSQPEWSQGVETEPSSLPEAMEPYIVPPGLDFMSSHSKKVPVSRSYATQPLEVAKDVLLEAIRHLIRSNKHEASEKMTTILPAVNIGRMPVASRSLGRGGPNIFVSDNNLETLGTGRHAMSAKGNHTIREGIPQQDKMVDRNLTNTMTPPRIVENTMIRNLVNRIYKDLLQLNNQPREPYKIAATKTNDHETNPKPYQTSNDHKVFSDGIIQFLTSITPMTMKNTMTPQSNSPLLSSLQTKLKPVELQPVAVTVDTLVSPEATTRITIRNSDNSFETRPDTIAYSGVQRHEHLGGISREPMQPMQSLPQLFDTGIDPNKESSFISKSPYGNLQHNKYSRSLSRLFDQEVPSHFEVNSPHRNPVGALNGFPIIPVIARPALPATGNIIANKERHADTRINQNTNISPSHNTNFNQGIVGVQNPKDEVMRMALPEVLRERTRSMPFNKGAETDLNTKVDSSRNTANGLHNGNRDTRLIDDDKKYSFLQDSNRQNPIWPDVNPNSGLREAVARVNSIVNQRFNRTPLFAAKQSQKIARRGNVAWNFGIPSSSPNLDSDWNMEFGKNMDIDALNINDRLGSSSIWATEINSIPGSYHRKNFNAKYDINRYPNRNVIGNSIKDPTRENIQAVKTRRTSADAEPLISQSDKQFSKVNESLKGKGDWNAGPGNKRPVSEITISNTDDSGTWNYPQLSNVILQHNDGTSTDEGTNGLGKSKSIPISIPTELHVASAANKLNHIGFTASTTNKLLNSGMSYNELNNHNSNAWGNGGTRSKPRLGFVISGGMKQVRDLAEPTMNMIIRQWHPNFINPVGGIGKPKPIIGRRTIIPALNSIDNIAGFRPGGRKASSIQESVKALNQASNLAAVQPVEILGGGGAANSDTSGMQNVPRQRHESINTDYNSDQNYYTDSNYNSNSSQNTQGETTKIALSDQTAPFGIGGSLDNNAKLTRGWYEFSFSGGNGSKDDWTGLWNNKNFKRFQ